MTAPEPLVLACSCERTMPLDEGALARGCGGTLHTADQLCRRELDRFRRAVATGLLVTVGCTQEAPLFTDTAEEMGAAERVRFANVRELAGWSDEAGHTGPKMAALLAAAAEPLPPVSLVSMTSEGVALVYGRDEVAVEAARRLSDRLDITVLLTKPGDIPPPRATDFPVLQGTIAGAKGHLGAFELRVNDYAQPAPSSRDRLLFGPPRDGAASSCDLLLDLTGHPPLFPAHELRAGYLRADPRDPAAVERLLFEASNLVGTFDKPRFVSFTADLCAHSRSRITGCTRCLDLCPTGAITPAGDHVSIDPYACAGCGQCAAACPTGAVAYALPPADTLLRRLRRLLRAYAEADGSDPVVLFHDGDHGEPLLLALGRYGVGLPANVLPVRVNEITQVGPEALAATLAYGAVGARFLARGRARHDLSGLYRTVGLSNTIAEGLGYGSDVIGVIETDDPDTLRQSLDGAPLGVASPTPSGFHPAGAKRGVLDLAFRELHRAAPAPVDRVTLGPGAPFGGLDIDVQNCTLCLSCTSACPTDALSANPDRPQLRFTESLCVQCGLCAATCPENVISLQPRLDFSAWSAGPLVVKEEEPCLCTACGKAFGVRSSLDRVAAKLGDRHWMFSGEAGEARLKALAMCEDCRVEAMVNLSFDPHAGSARPVPRTSDDYLRERDKRTDMS